MSRYNSFEDLQLDVQVANLERRLRNLEALSGTAQSAPSRVERFQPVANAYSSLSYQDITGFNVTYNKKSSRTMLRIRLDLTGRVDVASTRVTFGVDAGAASGTSYSNYDIATYVFTEANARRFWSYARDIPDDTGAGDLLSVGDIDLQVLVKVSGNQFSTTTDDFMVLEVTEIYPYA